MATALAARGTALPLALLQGQPRHLLETMALPPEELLPAVARLALRHSDRRVAALLSQALLPEMLSAAANGEPWTCSWWPLKALEAIDGTVEQLSLLLKQPWKSPELLKRLLRAWLEAYEKKPSMPSGVTLRGVPKDMGKLIAEAFLRHSPQVRSPCEALFGLRNRVRRAC